MKHKIPTNFASLHQGEEALRGKAIGVVEASNRLALNLQLTEAAMDLIDVFRQVPTDDEDLKVVQALGIRIFNTFGASLKLLLSGYSQGAALLLRDVLETVFLLDLFRTNKGAIARWRHATQKERHAEFRPVKVREALDKRDGLTTKKRAELYNLFSELAGHPSMQSFAMLRPKGMDIHGGPFIDSSALEAVLSEMGRLALQVGEVVGSYIPKAFEPGQGAISLFNDQKLTWVREFYPSYMHQAR